MTENKRYVVETDNWEISLKDNITKKYPFSIMCEGIDEFEPLLNEVTNVCAELNKNWEQTLRFEDYNKELTQRSVKYEDTIDELKHENNELTSIKRFADNHGITISKIDEAFRKCWNDNGKLVKDNEQLKQEYTKLKHYHSNLHDDCIDLETKNNRLQNDVKFLEKENKGLKSKVNDTQIAVEIATEECMQRVFDLIDEKIEKYEGARYIPDVLRLLKKELQS